MDSVASYIKDFDRVTVLTVLFRYFFLSCTLQFYFNSYVLIPLSGKIKIEKKKTNREKKPSLY